jgi:hypothetical protein
LGLELGCIVVPLKNDFLGFLFGGIIVATFKNDFLWRVDTADWNENCGGLIMFGLSEFLEPFRKDPDTTGWGSCPVILIARLFLIILVASVAMCWKFSAMGWSGPTVDDPGGGGETLTRALDSFSESRWSNGGMLSFLEIVCPEKIQLTDSSIKLKFSSIAFANQPSLVSVDSVCFLF